MRNLIAITILIFLSANVHAQKKRRVKEVDTLVTFRELMQACNVYKELPLQLNLELRNATNFVTRQEDTTTYYAEFYLQKKSSYVRFGEVEQFVDDSIALLVSNKMQKMILYTNPAAVLSQIKNMTNLQMKDSSVVELSRKYSSLKRSIDNSISIIELKSREFLAGSVLPKEIIELHYNIRSMVPVQVLTTKRTLIPLDQSEYDNLKKQSEAAGKLLNIESKGYYLIKEQNAVFLYKAISHEPVKIPVAIEDRIVREDNGEYKPAKGYEAYQVILN